MRRKDVAAAKPNAAHYGLADLEKDFEVHIITQNIDNLHERAGSKRVLHLHGEIFKMRSVNNQYKTFPIKDDIQLGQLAPDGYQLRPNIVWFNEPVPMIEYAADVCSIADIFVVVGTSLAVYPAAGLIHYTKEKIPKFIIDKQIPSVGFITNWKAIESTATEGIKMLKTALQQYL